MIWVGHVLDHVFDHMIIGLVTTALHQRSGTMLKPTLRVATCVWHQKQ